MTGKLRFLLGFLVLMVGSVSLSALDGGDLPRSLFISPSALGSVSDAEVRAWLEHICAYHRLPESPNRIDTLVLSSIADADPGDPSGVSARICASAPPGKDPRWYHPTNHKLDIISKYFNSFDAVYVGTVSTRWKGTGSKYIEGIQDAGFRQKNLQLSTNALDRFMATYPELKPNWYISYEANLSYFTDAKIKDAYAVYNLELCKEMLARRNAAILWSPNFWTHYGAMSSETRNILVSNLKDYFSRVPISEVHFQDHMGGTSALGSKRFTVDDAKHYYDLLVGLRGPGIRVNTEMFIRTAPKNFKTAPMSHEDYFQRMKDYERLHLPLGASWEIRYWYKAHQGVVSCADLATNTPVLHNNPIKL